MWADYLLLMGLLLLLYCFFRGWVLRGEERLFARMDRPRQDSGEPGHPIDAATLSHRLHQVRQNYVAERPRRPQAFKSGLRVKRKRVELERLDFFQKALHEETRDQEHAAGLFLV